MNTPVINSIPDDKKNVVASGIIRIREFTCKEHACNPCYNSIALVLHSINVIKSNTWLQMSL